MLSDDAIQLRPMQAAEVTQLVEWAAKEGWNPGLHDAQAFYATDADGFLAVEVNGQFVGGGAIVRHHASFGFMGLFIVRPEFRSQGIGRKLWFARRDLLASRLDPAGTIGLDAVEAMRDFYAQGGFVGTSFHLRFELATLPAGKPDASLVPLSSVPFSQVADFDRACFTAPRESYLKAWLALPQSHALASVQQGELRGYAVLRRAQVGWKIGPLFAADRATATKLFQACCQAAGEGPIYLDVPEANPAAIAMVEEFGMQPGFRCLRMYRGPIPTVHHERIFGITTLELG
ncbi:GNAT family N-acetyltransferase [Anatilimnocola sp. NA78]|uniref:GNAT family N-acetyltransferase n=1 Tax=Anatilimnocola sp. NA78 TaxID=3415683 RepID=UPI003CE5BB59